MNADLFRRWPPLYRWRRRRRLIVAGLVAVVACALASLIWRMADTRGAQAAQALADATQRLARARQQLATLPALRRAAQGAAAAAQDAPANRASPADDSRFLSQLATETGLTLLSLTPGAENRKEPLAGRFLKLTAQADFVPLNRFFRQLHTLPLLVVPEEVTIRREGDGLLISAVFQLFDELRAPAPVSEPAQAWLDPFTPPAADAPGSRALRLVGVIEDGTHAIALMETPDGMQTVRRGDALGGERVANIGMPEIVLSHGASLRALTWEKEKETKKESGQKPKQKRGGRK